MAAAVAVSVGLLPEALGRDPRLVDPLVLGSTLLLVLAVGLVVHRAAARVVRLVEEQRAALEAALLEAALVGARREARAEEVEHDTRSALGALRSALSTLDRYADELDRDLAHRLQSAALREVDHLERLLRQQGCDLVAFDVREVVRDVALTRQVAGLRVRTDEVAGRALGSPDDLSTVLGNLLVNAMRHAPGAEVRVSTTEVGDVLELRVHDDGPGISAALAPSVFERGVHGGHVLSTGLGLHISRELARGMGGALHLEPTPVGCCFVVTLVRAGAQPATRSTAAGSADQAPDRTEDDRPLHAV
ncbi:signal transduction histidine kinase [Nocardioides salarius]|uniref:histidine kinase n=1 Tax=Nocardioides salarius TaxID=374513 RepID=A0ABS2M6G5_9ACTN|nr:signal transduction histidine kinase [Nocardioides salarius]